MTLSMGIIAWIIIGALAGWIASKIMGTDAQMGALANIIVGIVGGLLGGWLTHLLFGANASGFGWILDIVVAIIGACILIAILKAVTGGRRTRV